MAGTLALEGLGVRSWRALRLGASLAGAALTLAACAGGNSAVEQFTTTTPPPQFAEASPPPSPPAPGNGEVRAALILPLSAQGNAGLAAQSMKNAADLALAEFRQPNVQLLIKDDAGNPQAAQTAAQEAIAEGAEIIVGPVFAQSVSAVANVARPRGVPIIAPTLRRVAPIC